MDIYCESETIITIEMGNVDWYVPLKATKVALKQSLLIKILVSEYAIQNLPMASTIKVPLKKPNNRHSLEHLPNILYVLKHILRSLPNYLSKNSNICNQLLIEIYVACDL